MKLRYTLLALTAASALAFGGCAQQRGFPNRIGADRAKELAFAAAELDESLVTVNSVDMKTEDGKDYYQITFSSNSKDYNLKVNAVSGEVSEVPATTDGSAETQPASSNVPNDLIAAANSADNTGAQASDAAANASTGDIGKDKAKAIALEHAGLSESEVTFVRAKLDYDDGRAEYEVEFWKDNTEYDYDIDAATGKILSVDHDAEYYKPAASTSSSNKASNSGSSSSSGSSSGSSSSNNDIGKEKAKSIALEHAGLSESEVTFVRAKLDYDDGRAEYEVEFWKDNTEYDYDIDAATGKILSVDHDAEYYKPSSSSGNKSNSSSGSGSDYIGASKAKSLALKHAGVSADDARGMECELDRDDGRTVYEIEFHVGRTEYDYEVDAFSGKIVKSERDYDDD